MIMHRFTCQPPRIVFLLTQDLHAPSGLGRFFPWAKYLAQEGYQVSILALHSNYDQLEEKEFVQEGVKVHYVAQMHVLKKDNKTYYFDPAKLIRISLHATKKLFQAGMKERADLIIVGKPHPMNSLAGLWIAKRKRIPIIVDCDDYEAESNHTSSKLQKMILRFFENGVPEKTNLVTTNTYFTKNRLIGIGLKEEKIYYLPNGVDRDRFHPVPLEQVTELKERLGLSGKKVIAYLGSLNLANHPVDVLFRAFVPIANQLDNVVLLIVGGGKDIDVLKALGQELGVSDKVVFTGRVQPEEMNLYYQLVDVSVDPVNNTWADHGRCPLKIFEGWQMGVPVVSEDVGDRKILAGEPPAILLSDPEDPESFSKILLNLIQDETMLEQMSAIGKRRVEQFTWEDIVRRSLHKINGLLCN